ncbi:MAG: hypothetical protein EWM72_01704 [Nitrospira sp.]|nr:MAG: hypothetical protein EWM72_01704 [Nitrospira sp.]
MLLTTIRAYKNLRTRSSQSLILRSMHIFNPFINEVEINLMTGFQGCLCQAMYSGDTAM